MDEFSEYYSIQIRNREVFEKNFTSDIAVFKALLSRLREIWARVGVTRDLLGQSHVGPASVFKSFVSSRHIRIRASVVLSKLPSVVDLQTRPRSSSDDREVRR